MIDNLGFFIDGTRADWRGRKGKATAIKRLFLRYQGQKEYLGGPGTDTRSWWLRAKETVSGSGRRERFDKLRQEIETWRPRVVDMGGWSRGGDDAREACEVCREMGVPVRFLFLIDPVPAYGWKALLRVVPFAPLQRVYTAPGNILEASPAYPLGGGIAQVLAGEEHSRILRRALIQGVPTRYVMGDHSDSGWRSEDTDDFVVEQGARYGVVFDPLDRTTVAQALGLYGGGAT